MKLKWSMPPIHIEDKFIYLLEKKQCFPLNIFYCPPHIKKNLQLFSIEYNILTEDLDSPKKVTEWFVEGVFPLYAQKLNNDTENREYVIKINTPIESIWNYKSDTILQTLQPAGDLEVLSDRQFRITIKISSNFFYSKLGRDKIIKELKFDYDGENLEEKISDWEMITETLSKFCYGSDFATI